MRLWMGKVLRVAFILAFFWIAGYVAWSAVAKWYPWQVLVARSAGVAAFGAILLIGWPPLRKRKALSHLLLGVCWASLGASVWFEHRDSLGLTLGVILTVAYVLVSWMEWKTGIPSSGPSAPGSAEIVD